MDLMFRVRARRMIVRDNLAYLLSENKLACFAQPEFFTKRTLRDKVPAKWEVPCNADSSMLLAADVLVTGGEDQIAAHRADDGTAFWSNTIFGTAHGHGRE